MDGIGIWLGIMLKRVAVALVMVSATYVGVLGWQHNAYSVDGLSRSVKSLVWRPTPVADQGEPRERVTGSTLESGRVVPTAAVEKDTSAVPLNTAPVAPIHLPAKAPPLPQRLDRESTCLARAIYHEAAHDPHEVRVAIAQVAMVRLAQSAGKSTMCAVVYHGMNTPLGCLFLATCRNSGAAEPTGEAWRNSQQIAADIIGGRLNAVEAARQPSIAEATHFHPVSEKPAWAANTIRLAQIGRFVFLGRRSTEAAESAANRSAPPTEAVVADADADSALAKPAPVPKKPLARAGSAAQASASAKPAPRASDVWLNASQ